MKMTTLTVTTLILLALAASELSSTTQSVSADGFYSAVPTAYMDDPRRNEWQQPEKVMESLAVRPGQSIADIGAGTGFFASYFARRVGSDGRVYAVDIDQDMVKRLNTIAARNDFRQLVPVLASTAPPTFGPNTLDLIFICDTYLFLENRVEYLKKLRNSMKKTGRLAIISFNTNAGIPGAPPRHMMVPPQTVIDEASQAGFLLQTAFDFLPYQDFLLFSCQQRN